VREARPGERSRGRGGEAGRREEVRVGMGSGGKEGTLYLHPIQGGDSVKTGIKYLNSLNSEV